MGVEDLAGGAAAVTAGRDGEPGLYDSVFTRRLAREVASLDPELAELDNADQPQSMAAS